jgi:hypothetical protein
MQDTLKSTLAGMVRPVPEMPEQRRYKASPQSATAQTKLAISPQVTLEAQSLLLRSAKGRTLRTTLLCDDLAPLTE